MFAVRLCCGKHEVNAEDVEEEGAPLRHVDDAADEREDPSNNAEDAEDQVHRVHCVCGALFGLCDLCFAL